MKKLIHKLRRQPEEVRRQIVYLVTFAGAVILVLLWIMSLGKTLGGQEASVSTSQSLQPLSVLKDNLVGGLNSISTPSTDATSQ
jgi:hypothetical protein